jgi:hypothetical protein
LEAGGGVEDEDGSGGVGRFAFARGAGEHGDEEEQAEELKEVGEPAAEALPERVGAELGREGFPEEEGADDAFAGTLADEVEQKQRGEGE